VPVVLAWLKSNAHAIVLSIGFLGGAAYHGIITHKGEGVTECLAGLYATWFVNSKRVTAVEKIEVTKVIEVPTPVPTPPSKYQGL
jgi:hypothetical protein